LHGLGKGDYSRTTSEICWGQIEGVNEDTYAVKGILGNCVDVAVEDWYDVTEV